MSLQVHTIFLIGTFVVMLNSAHYASHASADSFLRQDAPRQLPVDLNLPEGHESGPIIPGLRQGAVPQGLAYSKLHDLLFISSYFENEQHPSVIAVINQTSGRVIRTLSLKEDNSTFHYGHVGGLAVDERFLWVASGEKVYQYDLDKFIDEVQRQGIAPLWAFRPESSASFSTYNNGILWVGEFVYQNSRYHSPPSHHTQSPSGNSHYAWICGYETSTLNADTPPAPRYLLSVRQKVQGIQWSEDYVFLSISWGRRNDSHLAVYRNPLLEPPQKQISLDSGETIPLWYLDETKLVAEMTLPPLAEGITLVNGKLAILFESGAQKFQIGGKTPVDRLLLLDPLSFP